MPTVETSATSKAGITVSETGERHIPASVRADGSVRKEIRVRPGYRPPEDVEVYKNRTAEAWKNRGSGGVPGAEAVDPPKQSSAAANKNAKRREARKRAAAAQDSGEQNRTVNGESQSQAGQADQGVKQTEADAPGDREAEKEKEAKELSKKLRQARELKDKKDSGGALLPEQFEKVVRINELIRQLDSLGFNADGERKREAT